MASPGNDARRYSNRNIRAIAQRTDGGGEAPASELDPATVLVPVNDLRVCPILGL